MFAKLQQNLHREMIATHISKSSFYRWLNGGEPHFALLSKANRLLSTDTTLNYVDRFYTAAKQLSQTNELNKVKGIVDKAYLKDDDAKLLKEHHLKRIWRETNRVLKAKDLLDEC